MKILSVAMAFLVLGAALIAPVAAQAQDRSLSLAVLQDLIPAQVPADTAGPAITLDEAERIALAANPEIAVAARRVAVAEAHTPVAGALDDPAAMYRGWGLPLRQPWNFNQAQNMFSLSQSFPAAGKRALRTSVAQSDVDVAKAQLAEVRL